MVTTIRKAMVFACVIGMVFTFPVSATSNQYPPLGHKGYLVVQISRSIWDVSARCEPLPGTYPLDQLAAHMHDQDQVLTVGVVTGRTLEHERFCRSRNNYASWDDLQSLHDNYAVHLASQTKDYLDNRTLSDEQVVDQTCGSLDVIHAHGLNGSGELFWPHNGWDDRTWNLAKDCFASGRMWGDGINPPLSEPSMVKAKNANGGRCTDPTAECSKYEFNRATEYTSLGTLTRIVDKAAVGYVGVLQYYGFVTGTGDYGAASWDCTGPNNRHWTSLGEMSCAVDVLALVDYAASKGVRVVSPLVAFS